MRDIKRIIIHCSATPADMDIGVEEIRRWHVQDRNFSDVGYHYVIRRDGTVETGRPDEKVGAHAKGANEDSIGICLVGGVARIEVNGEEILKPDFNFTGAQMHSLDELTFDLTQAYDAEIIGHRDVPGAQKHCPCFDVGEWFS